jgi:molybdopterin molybdotransferase
VAKREDVEADGGTVDITRPVSPGQYVRRRAEVASKGEIVMQAGRRITPEVAGLIGAVVGGEVEVARRPLVAVIATGDELVPCETRPGEGSVRSSNLVMLSGLLCQSGCTVAALLSCRDSEEAIAEGIQDLSEMDFVLTTGGASGGRYDLVRQALSRLGAEILFEGVRMRPGRTSTFAALAACRFFILPGNAVSAMVAFHTVVRPALRKALGLVPLPDRIEARLASELSCFPGVATVLPARLQSDLRVQPVAEQSAADIKTLADADCLIVVPEEGRALEVGDRVQVIPLVD